MHLLRPAGDPCLLEHDGKAPLLGQHAGDEVLLTGTGRRPPASLECVPEGSVQWDEAVAQVSGVVPEGVARRVLLESAVPCWHCRGVRWGSKVPGVCRGHGVWGARSQGGPQGGQGGQSRGDGPLMGCIAGSRGHRRMPPLPLRGRRVAGRFGGGGALGVRGVPRRSLCLPLEDVGGRRLVFRWGSGVHRGPRQVCQHSAACVVLLRTQGAFRSLCGPPCRRERHRLADGALWRRVEA